MTLLMCVVGCLDVAGALMVSVRVNTVLVLGAVGVGVVSVQVILGVSIDLRVVVLLGVEGQGLVGHIVMLNTVLGLSLNLMEELVVLVLDVVLNLGSLMVVNIVTVGITGMVVVGVRVVAEVLISLVVVVVMVTAPERLALVMLRVLVVTALMVLMLLVGSVVVTGLVLTVILGPVGSGVLITVVHHVLVLSSVGVEVRVFTVVTTKEATTVVVGIKITLNRDVLMVNLLVLAHVVVFATVLVGPEELLVGGQSLVGHDSVLQTMGVVGSLVVRHDDMLAEACIVVGVLHLVRGGIEVAKLRDAVHGEVLLIGLVAVSLKTVVSVVVLDAVHVAAEHLIVVLGSG